MESHLKSSGKSRNEALALRHMAILRFSAMVLFSTLLADHFRGKPTESISQFLQRAQDLIRNMERNAVGDETMLELIPAIEDFVDDIISTAGINANEQE